MEIAKKRKTNISNAMTDSLYSVAQLVKPVQINIDELNQEYLHRIHEKLVSLYENKCNEEGFIQPNSIKVNEEELSACKIVKGNIGQFMVTFQCKICLPVEKMRFVCKVTGITMAMLQAESWDEFPSPILVFVSLEEKNNQPFSNLQKGDKIIIEVMSQRFELNHSYIEIIGTIISVD
jgi:hypothetical protein